MSNHFSKQPHYQQLSLNRIGMCDRGNAKAYFRFHGGIGDGNGRVAYRNTDENTVARPLQLFDDLISFDLKGGFMIGPTVPLTEVSGGTGVFLPVYPKKIRSIKGKKYVCGGCSGRMKQDVSAMPLVVNKTAKEEGEEREDSDQIPAELLLPAEWEY